MSTPIARFGRFLVAPLAVLLSFAMLPAAEAQTAVHMIVTFDESAGQNPEGMVVDRNGAIYVSVSPLGDLWRIPPGSVQPQPFGHVDGIVPGRDFGMLGLALDSHRNVYAAVQSADPAANGVWRFQRKTGVASHLPGSEAIVIPNGLAFDKHNNLYITDSRTGAIWLVPRKGGSARVWLQDAALAGDGSLGLFLGANGIAFKHGVFTVTNTELRTVLQIPKVGGLPGPISQLKILPPGDNPDGVALDSHGNAFVAMNLANAIGKLTRRGTFHIVASGFPLDFPSSVSFGTARGEREGRREREGHTTLFGVNFSIGEMFGLPPTHRPGVWKLNLGDSE
jgi:sugar lactone lactonase YvrE